MPDRVGQASVRRDVVVELVGRTVAKIEGCESAVADSQNTIYVNEHKIQSAVARVWGVGIET